MIGVQSTSEKPEKGQAFQCMPNLIDSILKQVNPLCVAMLKLLAADASTQLFRIRNACDFAGMAPFVRVDSLLYLLIAYVHT